MSLPSAITLPSSSREEKIAMCRGLLFETILIFVGNFLTIVVFALEKKLRKTPNKNSIICFCCGSAFLAPVPNCRRVFDGDT